MYHGKTIGVVIPAHNEALSIRSVIHGLDNLDGLVDHTIVCANACSDDTAQIAAAAGATVVHEPKKGYGAACLKAIAHLPEVDWVVFVDGDHAMRASDLPRLLDRLERGAQLVIGSRTLGDAVGDVESGAMTPHQKFGNWLAAKLLTLLWRDSNQSPVTDLGPFRAIALADLKTLKMQDRAYGWTVEMQAKALVHRFRVDEIPVASLKRIGDSKVSGTWRGSIGAGIGILTTIARIGLPAVWAQLIQSINIESLTKDSMWKKPS